MRPLNVFKFKKQAGQVFVIVALSLVTMIGSVGLAVDSGRAYMVKAKLNAAVDAAAIAAARAVTQGDTEDAQIASAQAAAQKFFAANYPAGYLGSTPTFPDPLVTFPRDKPGQATINATASATLPVTFMRVLSHGGTSESVEIDPRRKDIDLSTSKVSNVMNVAAAAETIRRDLDLAFVIDTSGSMFLSGVKVRDNAKLFVTKFDRLHDRMALIHFSWGAEVDDAIRPVKRGFDRDKLIGHIQGFYFAGLTNSAEGFWNARDQLNSIDKANRSSLRAIVFFSDGAPNTLASIFTFKTASDCTTAGSLMTGDDTVTRTPEGLWKFDKQNARASGKCNLGNKITQNLTASALPAWYNAHNPTNNPAQQEFHVAPSGPSDARTVSNNTSSNATTWTNVNRASRNLVEAMAAKARSEGIYVFTLGLGGALTVGTGPDKERGDVVLKCMANTADAKPSCVTAGAGQPVGIYCYAADGDALKPCFDKLASAILRLTK